MPELFDRLAELAGPGEPSVLYDRHGVLVVRAGGAVAKAHQADRDTGPALAARLRVAAALPDLLLAPLGPPLEAAGRTVTRWPYGAPVDPSADPPWEEGGRLLARLHRAPVPEGTPPCGRPDRAARLVGRLGGGADEDTVRAAFATLPPWIRAGAAPPSPGTALVHGDWHLGQLVRTAAGWRLIDVEDLGTGDPAWDLARPAALYLAGVLDPRDWARLTGAYRDAGGPLPADPWNVLDVPARTLAIQIAATCVISAREGERELEGPERALVGACARIARSGLPA
ncbi:phosphotransferase family protein [Actinomadura parmotrematis]|uniref:Aminoglycoside phosphotransferase family protein n=1 Tax=Actinomadura parmotrematis TaxID=2864039 RepID=A0ABS7FRT7_9ACTN|nr:phosphotransferase [Actinomadura parmotrematis]MBW8482243.1 aminoglycoside phosphotransferase family protein [Actinomadura parmotrematis]